MEKGAGVKGIIFLCFLLLLIVGGFFLTKKSLDKAKTEEKPKEEVVEKDIRIDKAKEYIYYENNDRIVDELDIEYKDITFNFKESTGIASKLNKETASFKEKLEYDEDWEDDSYDKLTYAIYKTYEVIIYDKYISLIVNYFEYDREDLVQYNGSISYVFDKETGKLYTDEELLEKFNISEDSMYDQIEDYVDGENLLREDEELDSEETINNIDDPAIYVDKVGRLSVAVLVKSDVKDYNEIIVLEQED